MQNSMEGAGSDNKGRYFQQNGYIFIYISAAPLAGCCVINRRKVPGLDVYVALSLISWLLEPETGN